MMYLLRLNLLLLALINAGCMTVEGPDGKYVLTNEGFKETKSSASNKTSNDSQSVSAKSGTDASSQRADYIRATRGGCYTYGRGKDPDPWTTVTFIVNKDIDIAYPRVLKAFGFKKWDKKYHYGSGIEICSLQKRFSESPGSHYLMRSHIKHAYGKEMPTNTIEVDLSKEGPDKVRVQLSYYSGHTKDKAGYEASLKQRVLKALE
jgi:hypothetical protein